MSARNNWQREFPFVILLFMSLTGNSAAQDRIDTNRPGFSSSPYVVKPGTWQMESGLRYVKEGGEDGGSTSAAPLLGIRHGLMDEMELLLEWVGLSHSTAGSSDATGITDAIIGVKFQLTDDQAATAFAFQAGLSMPLGADEFSSNSWDPKIGLVWAHSGALSLAGNAVVTKSGSSYQVDNGVKINFTTSATSSAFVEWEANIPSAGDIAHKLNGAYVWWPDQHLQYDVSATVGLNHRAPDYALELGFSYRF